MFSRPLFRSVRTAVFAAKRGMSSQGLHDILKAQIPVKQAALKQLKETYGNMSLGEVTVDQVCLFICCMLGGD